MLKRIYLILKIIADILLLIAGILISNGEYLSLTEREHLHRRHNDLVLDLEKQERIKL